MRDGFINMIFLGKPGTGSGMQLCYLRRVEAACRLPGKQFTKHMVKPKPAAFLIQVGDEYVASSELGYDP
jgi:hypothetical protein